MEGLCPCGHEPMGSIVPVSQLVIQKLRSSTEFKIRIYQYNSPTFCDCSYLNDSLKSNIRYYNSFVYWDNIFLIYVAGSVELFINLYLLRNLKLIYFSLYFIIIISISFISQQGAQGIHIAPPASPILSQLLHLSPCLSFHFNFLCNCSSPRLFRSSSPPIPSRIPI